MTEIKIDPKRWPALAYVLADDEDSETLDAACAAGRTRYGHITHAWPESHARAELAEFVAEREATATVRAAKTCEAMVVGGRAWNHDQAVAADALLTAANKIREPKP